MAGKDDIPGYRYDPSHNCYYKLGINESTLEPLSKEQQRSEKQRRKRLKIESAEKSAAIKQDKPQLQSFTETYKRPWHQILHHRESGHLPGTKFETNVKRKSILSAKFAEKIHPLLDYCDEEHECVFLSSPSDSDKVFALWKSKRTSQLWFTIFTPKHKSPSIKGINLVSTNLFLGIRASSIIDCCLANTEISGSILITSSLTSWTSCSSNNIYLGALVEPGSSENYRLGKCIIFSCAYNAATKLKAFGMEKGVQLYGGQTKREYRTDEACTALAFNNSGTNLFAGTRAGNVIQYDVLQPGNKCSFTFKVLDRYINKVIWHNEHQLILSAYDNNLALVDLRNWRVPVVKYEQHVNTTKKLSVTVDEGFQLLCVAGSDKVTRIWDINKAKPIKTIDLPPIDEFDIKINEEAPQATLQSGWKGKLKTPIVFIAYGNNVCKCYADFSE